MNSAWFKWSVVLVALIGVSTVILLAGRPDLALNPSANNFAPSGLSAFAELLKRNGYRVRVDRALTPNTEPSDVMIAVDIKRPFTASDLIWSDPEQFAPTWKKLGETTEAGGKLVILYISETDGKLSPIGEAAEFKSRFPKTPKLRIRQQLFSSFGGDGALEVPEIPWEADPGTDYTLAWNADSESARVLTAGKGVVLDLFDGAALVNDHIDEEDHARLGLEAIRLIAKPGATVVFVESTFRQGDPPSYLESMGRWAEWARYQVIICLAVVAYSLSRRFGTPVQERIHSRGSRELVDALAEIFRRGRKDGFALEALYDDSLERARVALRLPVGIKRKDLLDRLPDDLREACLNASEAAVSKVDSATAVRLAQKLLQAVSALEQDTRRARPASR